MNRKTKMITTLIAAFLLLMLVGIGIIDKTGNIVPIWLFTVVHEGSIKGELPQLEQDCFADGSLGGDYPLGFDRKREKIDFVEVREDCTVFVWHGDGESVSTDGFYYSKTGKETFVFDGDYRLVKDGVGWRNDDDGPMEEYFTVRLHGDFYYFKYMLLV